MKNKLDFQAERTEMISEYNTDKERNSVKDLFKDLERKAEYIQFKKDCYKKECESQIEGAFFKKVKIRIEVEYSHLKEGSYPDTNMTMLDFSDYKSVFEDNKSKDE